MIEVNDELVNKMKKESSGSDFKNSNRNELKTLNIT